MEGLAPVLDLLRPLLGDRLVTARAVRDQFSHDMSRLPPAAPDAVVFPETEAEVQAILAACNAHDVPVIPFGAGSSMEGHIIPARGGITLSTRNMARILEVLPGDSLAVVQPGVTRGQLNQELRATGMMFSVDPGADASLGGMASTRASGTTAVRYGTMRENVMALRAVTAAGDVLRTGSRARKSATGYDLTHLFIGAEGTLGVITELTVRLHPVPEAISAAVCAFPTVRAAVEAVTQTIQYGIPVARVEFLDAACINATNSYSKLDLPVAPTLFYEFHGSDAWVAEQAQTAESIAEDLGGTGFRWSVDAQERGRLWQARHDLQWALRAVLPGCDFYGGDICVPISHLAEAIVAASDDIAGSGLQGSVVGHVGDGNFHTSYLLRPGDAGDLAKADALAARMIDRALAVGGTVSGEHGLGLGKLKYQRREHGGAAVDAMIAIKRALDPRGIMNPGKMGQAADG